MAASLSPILTRLRKLSHVLSTRWLVCVLLVELFQALFQPLDNARLDKEANVVQVVYDESFVGWLALVQADDKLLCWHVTAQKLPDSHLSGGTCDCLLKYSHIPGSSLPFQGNNK